MTVHRVEIAKRCRRWGACAGTALYVVVFCVVGCLALQGTSTNLCAQLPSWIDRPAMGAVCSGKDEHLHRHSAVIEPTTVGTRPVSGTGRAAVNTKPRPRETSATERALATGRSRGRDAPMGAQLAVPRVGELPFPVWRPGTATSWLNAEAVLDRLLPQEPLAPSPSVPEPPPAIVDRLVPLPALTLEPGRFPWVDAVWLEAEFLLWKRRGQNLPPLVTTDPDDGVLPDATVLFGNERVGQLVRPGGRFRFGAWSDDTQLLGWEIGLTALGESQVGFRADSDQFPLLARPFFNFTDDLQGGFIGQDSFLVADPGFSTGEIDVRTRSDIVTGDVTCRRVFRWGSPWRVDLLAGYVTARIDESLRIVSFTDLTGQDTQVRVEDSFLTKNAFHGGHIGFELQRMFPSGATLDVLARVGFGNMRQWVHIMGLQETISGGVASADVGGLLAQSTNMGLHRRDVFAVAPEINLRCKVPLTDHLQLLAGYSFLYWNRVAQPAHQLDPILGVNPNQPPPPGEPQRPSFVFQDGDFYLHGVDVGLQWSY